MKKFQLDQSCGGKYEGGVDRWENSCGILEGGSLGEHRKMVRDRVRRRRRPGRLGGHRIRRVQGNCMFGVRLWEPEKDLYNSFLTQGSMHSLHGGDMERR